MEANIDNFINYTDSPSLFLSENFPELDFGFRSPETEISLTNNPPATTPSHSSDPSNQFSNVHSSRGPASNTGSGHRSPDTMTSSPDDESRYGHTGTHISTNSKKIHKRNKEEKKAKAKQELEQLLATTAKKYIPDGIDDPNLDDKTKRKMVQMVKNRVAAQKTRDKRKNYMSELEEVKSRLDEANRQLNERNRLLEQRVRDLEHAQARLVAENEELKRTPRGSIQSIPSVQHSPQMQYQIPQQQIYHPPHPNHPHMQQQPHNNLQQPMMNSPHYPSLPSTPQHLMQPRFQSMASMGSFDGFAFPQNARLIPNNTQNTTNNNQSHTTITIESNDSGNNSSGNNSNNGNQQFIAPFPVLSRGSSGKRNMYGYLLAITMVLACFTTLNVQTGKIVQKSSYPYGDPSDPVNNPPAPGAPVGPDDPTVGYGPDDGEPTSSGTDDGGTGTGTGTGNTGGGGHSGGGPKPGTPESSGNNDPTVQTDVATNNGTGTNDPNGDRSKTGGSDDDTGGTINTFFADPDTNEGNDDGTDTDTSSDNGVDTNSTNTNTNTTQTNHMSPTQVRARKGLVPETNGVGRVLLTEILDEIDAMNRDY